MNYPHRGWRSMPGAILTMATLTLIAPAVNAAADRVISVVESRDDAAEPDRVPVHIAGIHMVSPEQVLLLLADDSEERAVPIAVGRDQGIAIYLGKAKAPTPRPMTHDLLVQILRELDVEVERVTVTELREDTYYAEIDLRSAQTAHAIDSRPSDAIALAVRIDAPIFASPALLRPFGQDGEPDMVARQGRHLGLSVQELDEDLAESLGASGVPGVLVASVGAQSPAADAGLRRGDILREIDGQPTRDLIAYRRVIETVGETARFSVWRDGARLILVTP